MFYVHFQISLLVGWDGWNVLRITITSLPPPPPPSLPGEHYCTSQLRYRLYHSLQCVCTHSSFSPHGMSSQLPHKTRIIILSPPPLSVHSLCVMGYPPSLPSLNQVCSIIHCLQTDVATVKTGHKYCYCTHLFTKNTGP